MPDHRMTGNDVVRRSLRGLLQDQRAQSQLAAFPIVALLLVFLLGITVFVVKIRPAQVAVAGAARICVRQAATSLSEQRGLASAEAAARYALQAQHLNPDLATVTVTPLGPWDRFQRVSCRVAYAVDLRRVPFLALFAPQPTKEISVAYSLEIEPYKSKWEEP